jgi:ribosomal-protein-serine acetyltransferase
MNPLLINVTNTFTTQNLICRWPQEWDGGLIYNAIVNSKPALKPWMRWAQGAYSYDDARIFAINSLVKCLKREVMTYLIFDRKNTTFQELVGVIDLHEIDWQVGRFEFGYWLNTRCAGKGYMTEASRQLIEIYRTAHQAKRFEIYCDATNAKSRGVAERLGFKLDAILLKQSPNVQGEPQDTCLYSLVF